MYEEAMRGREENEWKPQLKETLNCTERKHTWTHTVLPSVKDAIAGKVLLKPKLNEQRQIACYKDRLSGEGYVQKAGVDYFETLGPATASHDLLLIVQKFVSVYSHVHHTDIPTSFMIREIYSEMNVRWNSKCYKSLNDLNHSQHLLA